MINEIPATISGLKLLFIRLGEMEDIDMTIDLKTKTMTFERIQFDENNDEWVSDEICACEIEDEMNVYNFLSITDKPLTFRDLQSLFSHKMPA